jgi:hypothetical protein
MTAHITMSQLCDRLLVVHPEVHRLMFAAMMPGLRPAEIKRIKRQEGLARQERRRLCGLIRGEIRLRLDAWDHGRKYSQMEIAGRYARQGTRDK